MSLVRRLFNKISTPFVSLNILHSLNDGFEANYLLLLPFVVKDLQINFVQVGSLGTLLYAFSIILALPAGYISLKIGGFKTLIIALVIYSLGFLGIGFTNSYFHLLLMFILGGIGLGLFHPIAFALIAKWTTKETRGSAMGSFSAVGDIGKITISTLLTFIVIYLGWKNTAILYGGLTIFVGFLFYFLLLKKKDTFAKKDPGSSNVSLAKILKNKQFIFAALTNVFDNFASQTLFVFLPFLLLARGFSPAVLGVFAGAFFIGNFIGRIGLGKLVDIFGNTKVFILSEILMAIFIVLLANTTPLYLIIVCSLILGIFTKGTNPIVKTMVSESVDHHGGYEKAYGLNSVFSNSAIAIAPLVLGYISQKFSVVTAFDVMALTALVAIIPALCFHFTRSNFIRS